MQIFSARRQGFNTAFTLVELLIVVAIIGIITFPLLITYRNHRTNQALIASAEAVANHTRSVHIFAREAQKQREWGIKNKSESAYTLYSTGASGIFEEQNYVLDNGIMFEENFDILFEIGTGDAKNPTEIKLITESGRKTWISVTENGLVEVVIDP